MIDVRKPYLDATIIDQPFLDLCAENLCTNLELVVEIRLGNELIVKASDRNKYSGGTFYEARVVFPTIIRTVGDWLNNSIEFDTVELELSNVDGEFNKYLPAGREHTHWVGAQVTVFLGLREVGESYKAIFIGTVTEISGFRRNIKSISLIARSIFDRLKDKLPNKFFTPIDYPQLEDAYDGLGIPIVLGDWTVSTPNGVGVIPATVSNGKECVGDRDKLVSCIVSSFDLDELPTSGVYLRLGDEMHLVPSGNVSVGAGNKSLTIDQHFTFLEGEDTRDYEFKEGDKFFVKCKGSLLPIPSASHTSLMHHANFLISQIDDGYSKGDKWFAAETDATITSIKSRVWIQDPVETIDYVKSLLNQARLEIFVKNTGEIELNIMRHEYFNDFPNHKINNYDVVKDSLQVQIDDQSNFNRARAQYNYLPLFEENYNATKVFRNQLSINATNPPDADPTKKKTIARDVIYPNLYDETQVINELKNVLRLASAMCELIDVKVTWRSMLLEIGDFVKISVQIGATVYDDVPAMVRSVGVDPQGISIPLRLWSFQMFPFKSWQPQTAPRLYSGIISGATADIVQE
jgi:hypothetical protein